MEIIELMDGVKIEVELPKTPIKQENNNNLGIEKTGINEAYAYNAMAGNYPKLNVNFKELLKDKIKDIILSFDSTIKEISEESKTMKKATIEIGLNFEASGSIYIVKAASTSSINVTIEWELK